jgi:hypothetical protein
MDQAATTPGAVRQADRSIDRTRVRRSHHDEPCLVRQGAVVAIETPARQQAVVLDAFLRARRAEARGGGIELDLQFR